MGRAASLVAFLFMAGCGGGGGDAGNPCAGIDCGHGTCHAEGSAARCDCEDGYVPSGLTCVEDGGDSDSDTDTDTDTATDTGTGCLDRDEDGACAFDDCDDDDPDRHPGATDNPTEWVTELVDAEGAFHAAIALDGTSVHMSSLSDSGRNIFHATNDSGSWVSTDVVTEKSPVFTMSTIAVDDTPTVHVASLYQDSVTVDNVVLYYTNATGAFEEEFASATNLYPYPSLAASGDDVHLAYSDCHVKYVLNPGAGARVDSIEAETNCSAGWVSVGAGAESLYVGYMNESLLWVADRDAIPEWDAIGLGSATGDPLSLAVDPSDEVGVAWTEVAAEYFLHVYVPGDTVGNELVIEGMHPSLDFDEESRPHLTYVEIDAQLMYGTRTATGWRYEEIDPDTESASPAIVAGPDALHVAYVREGLRHARRELADGIDQDCDGVDGVDADGDGYASFDTWGDDCDDENDTLNPGADDPKGGADANCDGVP